ncbi:mavicyanin-like [Hibiscus syriacus]|uniref:Protein FAR1-RELATED SEQUENCE n=1 Tax=Hibiscus syriacus TaxID=106335 RepID=A0A6A3BIL6_HIBSY|nr:mavicyanin-like [Hibiscus syriacus]
MTGDHQVPPPDLHDTIERGSQNREQLFEDDGNELEMEVNDVDFESNGLEIEENGLDIESNDLQDDCDQMVDIEDNHESNGDDSTAVSVENGISQGENYPPPAVGMEFESYDDAYNYYNCYSKELGFAIRVKSSWTKRNSKEKRGAVLCCNCEGFKTIKEANSRRKETRTGCLAMIRLRLVESNRWRVDEVKLEHNHLFDHERAQNCKSHKKLDAVAKRKVEPTVDVEVRTIKLYRTSMVDPVGYGSSNSLEGEINLNDEGCLRNVFWIDSRSRAAYGYFGDVLRLIPLACQTNMRFLLWHLLGAWLTCMSGRPPQTVITDHCRAMQSAISEESGVFQMILNRTVYETVKVEEFEMGWDDLIQRFGITDQALLCSLYEERERWAPVYQKDTFLAGMCSFQNGESMSSFFDGYVHKQTSLKEFFDMYELVLQKKRKREAVSDIESRDSSPMLKTRCSYELQLSKSYANEIFRRFQDEVVLMPCLSITQSHANGHVITYMIKEHEAEGDRGDMRNFEVMYDKAGMEVRCICSCFNFNGYLCRHGLYVLKYNGVEEVPFQYILSRWRKDFKRLYIPNVGSNNVDSSNPIQLFDHLYRRSMQVVEEGMISQDHYTVAWQAFKESLNKVRLVANKHV